MLHLRLVLLTSIGSSIWLPFSSLNFILYVWTLFEHVKSAAKFFSSLCNNNLVLLVFILPWCFYWVAGFRQKLHICMFFGILLLLISLLGTFEPAVKNNWSRSVLFKSQRSHWSNLSVICIKYPTFVFGEYCFNYPWPQIVQKNANNQLRKLHKWSFYYVRVAKAWKEGKNCCMFFSLKYLKTCLYSLKLKFSGSAVNIWSQGEAQAIQAALAHICWILQHAADIISWGR